MEEVWPFKKGLRSYYRNPSSIQKNDKTSYYFLYLQLLSVRFNILCTKSNADRNHPFHLSTANVVFHVSNKQQQFHITQKQHITMFIHTVFVLFLEPSRIGILEPDTMSHSLTIVSIGYLSDWSTNTQVLVTFIHSCRSREAQIWIQRIEQYYMTLTISCRRIPE